MPFYDENHHLAVLHLKSSPVEEKTLTQFSCHKCQQIGNTNEDKTLSKNK